MNTPTRLRAIRRELDEVAEHIERLAAASPDAIELVGLAEVAVLAGVGRGLVKSWRHRGNMPEPVAELACGTIWLKADIEEWLRSK